MEALNLIKLKQLIAERGFPTWTKVGYLYCSHATYVAQFMPEDFLRQYLKQALAAADSGDWFLEQSLPTAKEGVLDWTWISHKKFIQKKRNVKSISKQRIQLNQTSKS